MPLPAKHAKLWLVSWNSLSNVLFCGGGNDLVPLCGPLLFLFDDHLCVQWKDRSTSWERLADLKESYPVEVAEFAVSRGLDQQPAFAWWVSVSAVLKKRNHIIAVVKKRFAKKDFQLGYSSAAQCD